MDPATALVAYMLFWKTCRAADNCPEPQLTFDYYFEFLYGDVGVMGAMHRNRALIPRSSNGFYPAISTMEGREWCDERGWRPNQNPCWPAMYSQDPVKNRGGGCGGPVEKFRWPWEQPGEEPVHVWRLPAPSLEMR